MALQAADVAKTASKTAAPKATAKSGTDASVSREAVLSFLNESNKIFLEGEKGKPASSIKYFSSTAVVKNWMTLRFLEVDTEIDKGWYERVYKFLDYMTKARTFMESAKMNGKAKTPEYKKISDNFEEAQKRFAEVLKDPTPVDKKKLEKLREEKRKWELARKSKKSGSIKEDD
jgi:hypothetical protein